MPSLLKPLLPVLALASAAHGKLSSTRSISTDSKAGKSLLARAVRTDISPVEGGKPQPLRKLEIEDMGGMYIKYLGCSDFLQYGDYDWYQNAYNNANGAEGQNGQYNYNYNGQQGGAEGQNGQYNYNYNGQEGGQNGQNGQNGQYNYQQQQNGGQQGQYNQNQQSGDGDGGGSADQQQGYYGEDGQFYYYNYEQQQQAWQDVYMAHLVRFTLCENQGCYGCNGEYAVDMVEFVETYAEIGMNGDEYACEKVRENCYCYNSYREQCYYDCYQQAGVEDCMDYYGQAQFQIQEYMECNEMDYYPNNYADAQQAAEGGGGYYYNAEAAQYQNYRYWVGPYCSANADIYLGAFYDEQCMRPAGKSTFAANTYGESFPYFFEPIISQGKCISCMEPERQYENQQMYNAQQYNQQYNNQVNYNNQQYENNKNYNNQQYNEDEQGNYNYNNMNYENYNRNYNNQEEQQSEDDYGDANELCEAAMQESIKCDYYHGFTYGCDYINNVLPTLDGRRSFEGMYNTLINRLTRSKKAAIVFGTMAAIMLALVACMCGYMWTQDKSTFKIGLLESRRTQEQEFA